MRVRSGDLDLAEGFAQIRTEFSLPVGFAPEVEAAARAAVVVAPAASHDRRDRTDLEMVTLDPLGSTDLDQAFAVHRDGDSIILDYAIADVGAFVPVGGIVEAEAWNRGGTVYAPDGRIPQYPEVICEDAASLLPRGPRPCVLLTVAVASDGTARLRDAYRAVVSSRAQLAYEEVSGDSLGADVRELSDRVAAAERSRGAQRIEFPEQELVPDARAPGGVRLAVRDRHESEDLNSSLSLAANLAVAALMVEHRMGLFRSMPAPDEVAIAKLRKEAKGLSIHGRKDEGL
ncbi:MAG: RNB domain-containing ribonuclease [Acidimicrobiia bacterium]